jgi:hypothetical protein
MHFPGLADYTAMLYYKNTAFARWDPAGGRISHSPRAAAVYLPQTGSHKGNDIPFFCGFGSQWLNF